MAFSPPGQTCKAKTDFLVKFSNETSLIFDSASSLLVILNYYERKRSCWGCGEEKSDGLSLQACGEEAPKPGWVLRRGGETTSGLWLWERGVPGRAA